MKNIIKEIISAIPAIIVVPYLVGFISVNIYLHYQNIATSDALNINYLLIGFINLAVLLLPVASLIFSHIIISSFRTQILEKLSLYSTIYFSIGFLEINAFFDQPKLIPVAFTFVFFFIMNLFFRIQNLEKAVKVISNLSLITILLVVPFSWYFASDYTKIFIENISIGWFIGIFAIGILILASDDFKEKRKTVILLLLILFIMNSCAVIFSSQNLIPNLRISIGGLKPFYGKVFLNKDCNFQTKDSTSAEFKINNNEELLILFESDKEVILVADSSRIIIDRNCIKAVKRE